MKLSSLFLSLVLVSQLTHAGVLSIENGLNKIEGVSIAKSATLTTADGTSTEALSLIGAGLRTKKVLIANVKVYVAQIFLDHTEKFVRTNDGAVQSLNDMDAGAINLTFLRNVDAATVQLSFRDAFEANDIDTNDQGVAAFLNAVNDGGDAKEGKSMNISLKKSSDGKVTVVYENASGAEKTIVGGTNLFSGIMSIWLGEPADGGLETLKTTILKGSN